MKKLATIVLLLACANTFAQTTDSVLRKKVDELSKIMLTVKRQGDSLAKLSAANPAPTQAPTTNPTATDRGSRHLSFQQKLLVTAPLTVSLLFMVYFIYRLKKEGFKLADALSGDPVDTQILNPQYDPANTPVAPATITITVIPKSSSRLVAFFSGVAAVVISVTSVSYFLYVYYATGLVPDLDKMFTVILSLGIGITPYAFNKVAGAVK